eukprot:jgi/Picre1/31198/NNA_006552.t1
MTLIGGSYERFLFGYSHPASLRGQEACELKSDFTHAAHKGVVKSLAAAGPFLASGGADDLIHLYDLRHKKDLGFLMNPAEGSITALSFFTPEHAFKPTHLLAGCTDGTLTVWTAGHGWQCMKTLRGHRNEITSITIHKTGLLALTTSRDKTMRLWDLVKGRTTFHSKLEEEAEQISFSPSGQKYGIRAGSKITIFPVDSNPSTIKGQFHWYILEKLPAFALETVTLLLFLALRMEHRIKALSIPKSYTVDKDSQPTPESTYMGGEFPAFVATASSDGLICIWKLQKAIEEAIDRKSPIQPAEEFQLSSVDTRARLTTLVAMDSVDMMELLAIEMSNISKRRKNTAKKHRVSASQGDEKPRKKVQKKEKHVQKRVETPHLRASRSSQTMDLKLMQEARKVTKKTPEQLKILEEGFSRDKNPDDAAKADLASRTGLTVDQVIVWFSHRRRKDKREQQVQALWQMGNEKGMMILTLTSFPSRTSRHFMK